MSSTPTTCVRFLFSFSFLKEKEERYLCAFGTSLDRCVIKKSKARLYFCCPSVFLTQCEFLYAKLLNNKTCFCYMLLIVYAHIYVFILVKMRYNVGSTQ